MLVLLLPPFNGLRLPRVYEGTLNFLHRITGGNDSEIIISIAKFVANMKQRRRVRSRLNILTYLHIPNILKYKKTH